MKKRLGRVGTASAIFDNATPPRPFFHTTDSTQTSSVDSASAVTPAPEHSGWNEIMLLTGIEPRPHSKKGPMSKIHDFQRYSSIENTVTRFDHGDTELA